MLGGWGVGIGWDVGNLGSWDFGMLGFREFGILEFDISACRNVGSRDLGFQDLVIWVWNFSESRNPEILNQETPKYRNTEILESRNPRIPKSLNLELPKSQNPEITITNLHRYA